jgi:hypothetical protein
VVEQSAARAGAGASPRAEDPLMRGRP